MEDALHCNSDGMVVGVDRFWVVRAAGWAEWLSGGEKGFDGFVSQNEQRGHRPQTSWPRFVAAGVADAAKDLFAAEFFQIVSSQLRVGHLQILRVPEDDGRHQQVEPGGAEELVL